MRQYLFALTYYEHMSKPFRYFLQIKDSYYYYLVAILTAY